MTKAIQAANSVFASEEKIPFAEAARSKQFAKRPVLSTLHRWRSPGVRGIRLEAVRMGSRWYTSEGAISRFNAALNQPENDRANAELVNDGC